MKNIISILALSLLVSSSFIACSNEEDDIFDDQSAIRLEQAKAKNKELLPTATNGWAMEYYPNKAKDDDFKGKGYMLLTDFDEDGSVKIAMKNKLSGGNYAEETSLWDVIADNGPVLTFNSYNSNLHIFASPEDIAENVSGNGDNEQGLGYEGDYEFILVDSEENDEEHLMLKGKKRGMYVRLTRIPEDITWPEYYAKIEALTGKLFAGAPNHVVLTLGDKNFDIYDISTTMSNVVKGGGDIIADANYIPLINTIDGLRFRDPIDDNKDAQEFIYDESKDMLVSVKNSNVVIKGLPKYEFMWSQISQELSADRKGWIITPKSGMSEKFLEAFEKMTNAFKEVKYQINSFTLTTTTAKDGSLETVFKLAVRNAAGAPVNGTYYYDMKGEGDALVLTYKGEDTTGANFLKFQVEPFVKEVMAGEFVLMADKTNLNLSTVKLVAKDDPETWVVVSLK